MDIFSRESCILLMCSVFYDTPEALMWFALHQVRCNESMQRLKDFLVYLQRNMKTSIPFLLSFQVTLGPPAKKDISITCVNKSACITLYILLLFCCKRKINEPWQHFNKSFILINYNTIKSTFDKMSWTVVAHEMENRFCGVWQEWVAQLWHKKQTRWQSD